MKAIVPAAGQGTRLYPQTHTKPKAMVRLSGKPILGHILSSLDKTVIDEVVVVIGGPMQEQIIDYASETFGDRFTFEFVEQETAEGLGHSIYQTKEVVRGTPALIALGDMLFENGYQTFLEEHRALNGTDGSIGVKEVSEPQHYGVTEITDGNRVEGLVEKPDDPPSDYAISGAYIIEDTTSLFDALDYLIENDIKGAGEEYQLTDALQRMLERDRTLHTFEVEDWYDCGRPQTLLEANRVLLSKQETNGTEDRNSCVVVPPVDFGDDVTVDSSVIGPYVSVNDDTTITDSIVQNTIIGEGAMLDQVNIESSIVGDNTDVMGESNSLNIGDNSSINL